MNTTTSILIETKRLLNEVGWTKNASARNSKGQGITAFEIADGSHPPACFCLIAAMGQACRNLKTQIPAYDIAYTVIMNNIVTSNVYHYSVLSHFNDDPQTTLEMINATLDQAISNTV